MRRYLFEQFLEHDEPLGIFDKTARAAIRRLLDESGLTLHASAYGTPGHSGWLDITPGDRRISVDRIVTLPRLVGPHLRGIACDHDASSPPTLTAASLGLDGAFAARDATSFPVKQGGLAARGAHSTGIGRWHARRKGRPAGRR